jgi:glycine oxidase
MNSPTYDLMLCGGGVVGLSIAYQCASVGWNVLVVDSDEAGASSWAGAGILPASATVPALDPLEQLRALSHGLHKEWHHRLLKETGIDNEFRQCGGLHLGRTNAERATLSANRMWWEEHGIAYENWSMEELTRKVPSLRYLTELHGDLTSMYLPDECRLRNPRHLQALKKACLQLGVDVVEHCRIDKLETVGDRIVAARMDSRRFNAKRFCITSGAWASQLLRPLGIETGIMPVRGQMILYKMEQPPFPMVINDGHRYLVPRDDGHVLAGSCEEEVGFDSNTTAVMLQQLQEWAVGICPHLDPSRVEQTWAGLRPGSFDTYPYLGTLHPFENGFVAAGHFRHGLHWSPGTAVLMYQWMDNQKTDMDIMPFCVQRGQTLGNQLQNQSHPTQA